MCVCVCVCVRGVVRACVCLWMCGCVAWCVACSKDIEAEDVYVETDMNDVIILFIEIISLLFNIFLPASFSCAEGPLKLLC